MTERTQESGADGAHEEPHQLEDCGSQITQEPVSCRNCGAPAKGTYCTDCGQQIDVTVPTLGEFIHEYLNGMFNFDSRAWRTLRILLFKPGMLTCEFINGRRASYVAPIKVYLLVSLLCFLVSGMHGPSADVGGMANTATDGSGDQVPIEQPDLRACGISLSFIEPESRLYERISQICRNSTEEGGVAFEEAFSSNGPLLSFLVIPLMAALFQLFYLFSHRSYLEHLTFLLHFHSFAFLVMTTVAVLGRVDNTWGFLRLPVMLVGFTMLFGWLPAYIYLAMRRVYRQGPLLTLVKIPVLMLAYAATTLLVLSAGTLAVIFTL